MTSPHGRAAFGFAVDVMDTISPTTPGPAAFVLDVALLADGTWVVLETNPAWSSGQYGADLGAVIECLFAVNDAAAIGTWAWNPDPYLVHRARQQRILRA